MKILGIESSCDETACAIVEDGKKLSNVVATQIPFHEEYMGVVPEIASRKHIEWILPVVKKRFKMLLSIYAKLTVLLLQIDLGLWGLFSLV